MLLLSRTKIAILLVVAVQYVVGAHIRVVHVSELISNDDDFSSSSGKYNNSNILCCVYGNCTCNSLDHALANITSNVQINITTNVTLSSLIERSGLQNISIFGHNNPTVNCRNDTGIHFNFCHNCIIQGIAWNKCGSAAKAGLQFNDPSNITIQKCSFQHSLGQALVLSEVSGNININNCNFVNNSHYGGHGAAIHYYSSKTRYFASNFVFNINDCKFTHNKHANSSIYIESRFEHSNINLCNSIFQDNKGVSIFLVNQKICLHGNVLFLNNSAENGAGMYINNYSTVVFGKNSNVTFIHNSADKAGGAIFSINHSGIIFNQNSKVKFSSNSAAIYGATICALDNSKIIFTGNSKVEFHSNVGKYRNANFRGAIYIERYVFISFESNAITHFYNSTAFTGGVIYALNNSHISLKDNSAALFTSNAADFGGAVYLRGFSSICFDGNSTTAFTNNTASNSGGAIRAYDNSNIFFKGSSTTMFYNNPASLYGGAIGICNISSVSFEGNSNIEFSNNSAVFGGAMHLKSFSNIHFKGTSTTVFNNNTASDLGGAIYPYDNSNIYFEENSIVQFTYNSAEFGGAVYSKLFSNIYFEGNSTTIFHNNTVSGYGGAICLYNNSNIYFEGNLIARFNNNSADYGGAVYVRWFGNVYLKGNSTTVFNNNTASEYGGAMRAYDNSNISFGENSTAMFNNNTVTYNGGAIGATSNCNVSFNGQSILYFIDNSAELGGAVYSDSYSNIYFEGNSTAVFNNNNASDNGGAMCNYDSSNIFIQGNSVTKFNGNTAKYGGATSSYRNSNTFFKGRSTTVFSNNIALRYGAVVYAQFNSDTAFDGNSKIILANNKATNSTTLYSTMNSKIITMGNSSVTFNNTPAKWCSNICLPYSDHGDSDIVTVDAHGIVRCSYQGGFTCLMKKCYCNEFETDLLDNDSLIIVKDTVILSLAASRRNLNNVSIIGHNNPFVYCVNGSRLIIVNSSNITIKGITWIGCGKRDVNQVIDDFTEKNFNNLDSPQNSKQPVDPAIYLRFSINVEIQNCVFRYSEGRVIVISELLGEVNISHCDFLNNSHYRGHGAAIHYTSSDTKSSSQSSFAINDCNFAYNKFAESLVYIENGIPEQNDNITIGNSNFYHNQGVSIRVENHKVSLTGKLLFSDNIAANGSGIYIINSTVTFCENSDVAFTENIANHKGSAVFLQSHSTVLFDQNSKAMFHRNKAINGTIYSETSSNVIFKGTCQATFSSNLIKEHGAAIHSFYDSDVTFKGNATVSFNNNYIASPNNKNLHGGIIFSEENSNIYFKENSVTEFSNNTANFGAAMLLLQESNINFKDRSKGTFNDNTAIYGGAIASYENCNATIEQFSSITFTNNVASKCGGALYFSHNSNVSFTDNSVTSFADNRAKNYGGAVCCNINSGIQVKENSTMIFENNTASFGENLYTNGSSFADVRNANLKINNSTAKWYYGGLFTNKINNIVIDANGIVRCNDYKKFYICQHKQCYCENIKDIPSNVIIIFTRNITLNSILQFENIANISLIGHNSSSIRCENNGGLQFKSCSNVSITNLTWHKFINSERNSSNNRSPQIKFYNSSNIAIDHCTFQQSVGQAIVLTEVSGSVNIKYCKFVNFNHPLREHGAAIHYSMTCTEYSQVQLIISDCYFTDNFGIASLIYFEQHNNSNRCESILIILQNSEFNTNQGICVYLSSQNLYIKGNVVFENNEADNGAGIFVNDHSNVMFDENSNVTFVQNTATINGGAIYVDNWSTVVFEKNALAVFSNNKATKSGGTIYSCNNSGIILKENSTVWFAYSNAEFGGTLCAENNNFILTKGRSKLTISDSKAIYGGAIYFKQNTTMAIIDHSTTKFNNNEAIKDGGCIFSDYESSITFKGNSIATFYNSKATQGGVMHSCNSSGIILDENSQVWFNHSTAELGGTLHIENHSYIITKGISMLTISNSAGINGGASYLTHSSNMTITKNSTGIFLNNEAESNGGSIYSTSTSSVIFSENSVTKFYNSRATKGGTIYSYKKSNVMLDKNSKVYFNHSTAAELGGTLYIETHSYIITKGMSILTISNSEATSGGASYLTHSSNMTITENSKITFLNNEAKDGGGIYSILNSNIMFKGCSIITITNNKAMQGGAIYSGTNSSVEFDNSSIATFNMNAATKSGGCVYTEQSTIEFKGTCRVMFNNSEVFNGAGGAIFCRHSSSISFISCNVTFHKNTVYNGEGGAICCTNSNATFERISNVKFNSNKATYGGAADFNMNASLVIKNNTIVTFNDNSATMGGAVGFHENSNGTFEMNSTLVLRENSALQNGGAFYLAKHCYLEFKDFVKAEFDNNNAEKGGAIFSVASESIFKNFSTIMFKNNTALHDGGAIYIAKQSQFTFMEGSNVTFYHNRASDYGGAIYSEMDNSKMIFGNSSNVPFLHNSAGTTGNAVYMNLPKQCNSACLNESVTGITKKDLPSSIITSPNKIQLYNSKLQCIDFVSYNECDLYYIQNIMLGQKILLDACMYDYYNHPANVALFFVSGSNNQGYRLDSNNTLITCNHTLELVSIYGNESTTFNYSINISLYDNRQSEFKEVMTQLMVELSLCHPGFSYNKNSHKCECYNATEDIVFCSGSSSTIKRGYWFGNVTGKPTTAFCPINYCNFACYETSNGYYHLSPVRDNQCSSHRNGTACGNCKIGYTLSYDSTECVNVESCTAGHTVLVVLLTVLYWILMVTLVFGIMYYKVGIGYLYGITYYYSIVDILLSRNMYACRGLYFTVNIMSSFSKIIPQFLGELCVVTGLSGIDQQFIHYIHPLAVILILITISLIARRSQRISVFISRGIIHVICLLLLLSYTSIASTSLLLMRPLKFDGIDEVYTYLSPDIKFFHDRHLAYGIVALLFMIFIVIGPPLLLTLEPFINHKLNFTKIKPLLDQFQGCYKDKYRCFAGYYMICRVVIITIAIADLSNDFVANYLLIITCGIIALIHLLVKPYNSGILNKLDGIILQLIIFTEALSLFNDYDSPLVVTVSYVLVILPLLMIIGIAIFLHKDDLQKRFRVRDKPRSKNELLMADYHLIVSNDMRENATTCDV